MANDSVSANNKDTEEKAPEIKNNPFQLIAYLLFKVRHSLEDLEESNRPPRWVRIARAREAQGEDDFIGRAVKEGVNGFAEALSYLLELSLDIQEILVQTDAAKALAEVSLDFVKASTDDKFIEGVESLTGSNINEGPLSEVRKALEEIKKHMDYIPDPDDLHGIGHELYRLLCIEQMGLMKIRNGDFRIDLSIKDAKTHILESSGKIRLMQWAFDGDLTTFGLGPKDAPEDEKKPLFRFGNRRIWKPTNTTLPTVSKLIWEKGNLEQTIFDFSYNDGNEKTLDIKETHDLLVKLGYTEPASESDDVFNSNLTKKLRRFQVINELPVSGQLDNETINRLLHFDFSAKNIKRARPFDSSLIPPDIDDPKVHSGYFPLVNPGADDPQAEDIEMIKDKPGLSYYVVGRSSSKLDINPESFPQNGGWISDNSSDNSDLIQGFVALKSRAMTSDESRFIGGKLSEGEAAMGSYFFVARHTEPWISGRNGEPGDNALFGGEAPDTGEISRIYQWVSIDWLQSLRGEGYDLLVTLTALRRSLYIDRSRETRLPDQGKIILELYEDSVKENRWIKRDHSEVIASHESGWFPDHATTKMISVLSETEVARKRIWIMQKVKPVSVPKNAQAILVMLEGKHQSGWDIDAYFDNVQLKWELKKNTQG